MTPLTDIKFIIDNLPLIKYAFLLSAAYYFFVLFLPTLFIFTIALIIYFIMKTSNGTLSTSPTIIIEKVIVKVTSQTKGGFFKKKENRQMLAEIFNTLEWNVENKQRIEALEKKLKNNKKAINEIRLLILKLVEEYASNKTFLKKLENFAYNLTTSIGGSIIANLISNALK